MPRGIASAKQLAMMTRVLDAYCAAHAIDDPIVREDIGAQLIELFDGGLRTEEEMKAALKCPRPGDHRNAKPDAR